ncbi:helix-turn-helix transcriptional regulator [Microbulbifer hydrolyticus]
MHDNIEHACDLLDCTDLSVGEIAFQLGYDDPLYFSRVFKRVIGLSPSSYRDSAYQ